ncbi:hypothetical protein BD779DRAFT_1525136 [Infundibulicybe gibba]|nr:hypothetical protein BD779DRAFT_1525136 [Infundibulicybe gibba]
MASMQPFLIEGGHFAQISQLKAVISEVQDSLNEAHRVTDLLRDKLHHTTAQLAESMAKGTGMDERVAVGRNLDRFGPWTNSQLAYTLTLLLETKFEELTGRIIKREEESVEALAEAALAEAKVAMAVEKLKETQITLEKKEEELVELSDVLMNYLFPSRNDKLRLQIDSAEHKTSELAAKNHEISGKLLETEHNLRCQEKETIALQSELKFLRANAEELRFRGFNESEANAQKSKEELSSMVFKENVATKKNDAMEAELLRMRGEINHLNESLRQSNSQLAIIQDRFDSQAATLRLAREESGDLQVRP